jgi:ParB family chromosome partitioning protein
LLQEEVAKRVGKDRSTVANALRLLRLPEKVKNDLIESRLSMGHARALLALENEEDILEASDEIIRKKLSVRETEKLVKKIKNMFGSGAEKPRSSVREIDPNVLEVENSLRQQLGTQVKVHTKNKGGRIEISYHDQMELSRILELLGV